MAKHTKGPWTTEAIDSLYPHEICLGYEVPGEGSPVMLATVFFDEEDSEPFISAAQANANARLISAAPDLLAALIQCRDQLVSIGQALGEFTQESDVDAMNAADAAIEKATGSKSGN